MPMTYAAEEVSLFVNGKKIEGLQSPSIVYVPPQPSRYWEKRWAWKVARLKRRYGVIRVY
jgi:hypothetical protein